MKIVVNRQPSANGCTIGQLYINGSFECYTLEPVIREIPGQPVDQWKIPNTTAIPVGTYPVITDFSNRFQRIMLHVLNVPGFEGIRLHEGNFSGNTDGCLLLGLEKTDSSVLNSRVALEVVQPIIQKALDSGDTVTITIHNP